MALGQLLPNFFQRVATLELAQVNLPVGVLIWVMIIPMLLKIDFGALGQVRSHARGIGVTLFINWAVKPFSMALLGWIFLRHVFAPWLPADQIDSYVAGLILLAAAPCTAMVFVWSQLCRGDPYFTLSQVALNDAIMVVAFAPIVALLLGLSVDHGALGHAARPRWACTSWCRCSSRSCGAGSCCAAACAFRARVAATRPAVHRGPAAHAGAAVRLPGRGHPRASPWSSPCWRCRS